MVSRRPGFVALAIVMAACTGILVIATKDHLDGASVATVQAASLGPTEVLEGGAYRHTEGERAVYVPARVTLRDGRFDLLVHFHGAAVHQEKNVDQAELPAVVVSVNGGTGSGPYAEMVSSAGAFDAIASHARRALVKARGREDVDVGRIALSSWSAGGAAVRLLIDREPDRFDAVLVADGLFSTFADPKTRSPAPGPLAPFVRYARRAAAGDALFVLTHTDIDTRDYPSTSECSHALLAELGFSKETPPPGIAPLGGEPTYAVDRGAFHVRGFSGKAAADHVAQIEGLDVGYRRLRARWQAPGN
jgi:hypothetical protein